MFIDWDWCLLIKIDYLKLFIERFYIYESCVTPNFFTFYQDNEKQVLRFIETSDPCKGNQDVLLQSCSGEADPWPIVVLLHWCRMWDHCSAEKCADGTARWTKVWRHFSVHRSHQLWRDHPGLDRKWRCPMKNNENKYKEVRWLERKI